MSSDLQDRIDDLVRTEHKLGSLQHLDRRRVTSKEIKAEPPLTHYHPRRSGESTGAENEPPVLSYSAVDPLVLGLDEREAAYTFKNLNYVKAKLFDPEITYLHTKFIEGLQEVKLEMIAENNKMLNN